MTLTASYLLAGIVAVTAPLLAPVRTDCVSIAPAVGSAARLGLADGDWGDVALGVRAEDVRISSNGDAPSIGAFGAAIQLLEPIGSDTFVELGAGDATVVARVAPDTGLRFGEHVQASLTPGRIHLFEREQGQRIID